MYEQIPDALPLLSVVVPMHNEAGNAAPLIAEIAAALTDTAFEIVAVDDGSTDHTAAELNEAAEHCRYLRVLHHRTCSGQSMAVITGVKAARGYWIATLDGDGQNDPADIKLLLAAAQKQGASRVLIAGFRRHRRDSVAKRWGSRFANAIRRRLLGDGTPDTGCGLKVFRREDFLAVPQFNHMHRFLPALFLRHGASVVSVEVNHRPRTRGRSHYGSLDRLIVGVVDLAGVWWLQRRWSRPEIVSIVQPASVPTNQTGAVPVAQSDIASGSQPDGVSRPQPAIAVRPQPGIASSFQPGIVPTHQAAGE